MMGYAVAQLVEATRRLVAISINDAVTGIDLIILAALWACGRLSL
jgi:hypothetical protein